MRRRKEVWKGRNRGRIFVVESVGASAIVAVVVNVAVTVAVVVVVTVVVDVEMVVAEIVVVGLNSSATFVVQVKRGRMV